MSTVKQSIVLFLICWRPGCLTHAGHAVYLSEWGKNTVPALSAAGMHLDVLVEKENCYDTGFFVHVAHALNSTDKDRQTRKLRNICI